MKNFSSYVSARFSHKGDDDKISSLPSHSSAILEKHQLRQLRHKSSSSAFTFVAIPIPYVDDRWSRIYIPLPSFIHQFYLPKDSRLRRVSGLGLGIFIILFTLIALHKHFTSEAKQWRAPSKEPPTLVFAREDLRNIWDWEITSGHYPSSQKSEHVVLLLYNLDNSGAVPAQIGMKFELANPALAPLQKMKTLPSRYRPPPKSIVTATRGVGAKRTYIEFWSKPPNVAYPPRPIPGSVADLDIVMQHCDFSTNKYVRDCLEVLRVGGGLDNGNRLRRGSIEEWKYIYVEDGDKVNASEALPDPWVKGLTQDLPTSDEVKANFFGEDNIKFENHLHLPEPLTHHTYQSLPSPCDFDHPRIFHMFWTGPFTDKPYLALLSFLFTQNLGLDLRPDQPLAGVCRPQFWLWINPGPAASVPNPSARHDMFEQLKANPWASPFLHSRFKDIIQFKLWNTTEQLDGITELKDEWRALRDTLFNSGGHIISVPGDSENVAPNTNDKLAVEGLPANVKPTGPSLEDASKFDEDDMLNRLGSKSSSTYDRLSVILSDMARFVLCHRFGGTYLDADTIFLRDWEELWGWKGAFAYRWSRLEKYNTAVLRMNKNSALGTFLFRTALRNGLDFHPMTVSLYARDAYLEGLLLRLPDALFDPAWLNTEFYQRERPPQPYFTGFDNFFDTPLQSSAGPQALGFDGFFRGAYSYHFHNFWWKPFDPNRNWPDLGTRFVKGERLARAQALSHREAAEGVIKVDGEEHSWVDKLTDDKRDLDWATVLKRTFESYIRGERPNMYGEWILW